MRSERRMNVNTNQPHRSNYATSIVTSPVGSFLYIQKMSISEIYVKNTQTQTIALVVNNVTNYYISPGGHITVPTNGDFLSLAFTPSSPAFGYPLPN